MDRPYDRLATRLRDNPLVVDGLLAGATALLALTLYGRSDGAALLVSLLLIAPLAWRRRAPVAAAAVVAFAGLVELGAVGMFLPANVAVPAMIYALAAYAPPWAGKAGLAAGLAGAVLATGFFVAPVSADGLLVALCAMGITVVAAWALGNVRRARLLRLAALEERAQLLELERDQEMRLAATAERARIARELHDVVAHSLSVVVAQADGGRYAGKADPDAAIGALDAIAATGRQALTDMRSLLGVLRDGGGEEYAPQPDVAAIPVLVDDVRASGLDIDLIVEGEPRPLPAGPQLAAYRIVQESLTNVLKHAGPAGRAWVRLQWRPEALELSVLDDGRGAAAMVDGDGSGQGVRGMAERARLHGGRLEAGPRSGGGFGVHAALPYGVRS